MKSVVEKMERQAMNLPVSERAFLADRLLSSLDDDAFYDVDAAWVDEAERRYEGYKSGKRRPVPASQVLAEADRIIG